MGQMDNRSSLMVLAYCTHPPFAPQGRLSSHVAIYPTSSRQAVLQDEIVDLASYALIVTIVYA
jgi:hypothetical protein